MSNLIVIEFSTVAFIAWFQLAINEQSVFYKNASESLDSRVNENSTIIAKYNMNYGLNETIWFGSSVYLLPSRIEISLNNIDFYRNESNLAQIDPLQIYIRENWTAD